GFQEGTDWVKMPSGLIIQRGTFGYNPGITEQNITLRRAFTSSNYGVTMTWSDRNNDGTSVTSAPAAVAVVALTKKPTGFRAWMNGSGYNVDYIAVGY
ncbi:gp53-like domain-containing protein, partial [Enterobacter asburiae]